MQGIFGKPIKDEYKHLSKAYDELSYAYGNMFLPTVLFDRESTKDHLRKAKAEIEKIV